MLRHFIEGKISWPLRQLQEYYYLLHCPTTQLTIDSWMRGFIGKLLKLTHSQWVFHNITKHHHTNKTDTLYAKQDVMREIER